MGDTPAEQLFKAPEAPMPKVRAYIQFSVDKDSLSREYRGITHEAVNIGKKGALDLETWLKVIIERALYYYGLFVTDATIERANEQIQSVGHWLLSREYKSARGRKRT